MIAKDNFTCYVVDENLSDETTQWTLANSYGGIPALFTFHSCNLLIILSLFCLSWGLCGRTVVSQELGRKRFESINISRPHPHVPRNPHHRKPPTFGDSWFYLRREDLLELYGEDALAYLHFQRYIIFLLTIMTFSGIVVLMPVNILKGRLHALAVYENGTVDNLRNASNYHFVHMILSILYFPLTMAVMARFIRRIIVRHRYEYNPKALWMRNIPSEMRRRKTLLSYLQARYPHYKEEPRIWFAHCTDKLEKLCNERLFVEKTLECVKERTNLFRKLFNRRLWLFCRGPERARPFYQMQYEILDDEILHEKFVVERKDRLGTAFIVFEHDLQRIRNYENCEATREKTFKVAPAPPVEGEFKYGTGP